MEKSDLNPSKSEIESVIRIICDGWYNLLDVYDEMDLFIEEQASRRIVKNDFIDEKITSLNEDKDLFTYEMLINYREQTIGKLKLKAKGSQENFDICRVKQFAREASDIRRRVSSSFLLPPGLFFIDMKNNCVWKNHIADEIIYQMNLPENDFIRSVMGVDNQSENQEVLRGDITSWSKMVVVAEDIITNGFQLAAIKIPVLVNKEITGFFVILGENSLTPDNRELENKSAVIKEIHHRVKNNLQTIASLLHLQMRRVKSKTVEKAFKESINRISSIAIIHEELSKGGIEKVNIKSTIANIMEMILTTMVPPGKDIKGELSGSDIYLNADKASSLSLCITELVQNSVEHAFPFRKRGLISVNIEEIEDLVVITLEDNGIGFGGRKAKNSLGLEIIEMITTETLNGSFHIEGHIYGTKTQIKFPIR